MKNKQKAIALLDQILEMAISDDAVHGMRNRKSKASTTIGESWYVFHLKLLKQLLEKDEN